MYYLLNASSYAVERSIGGCTVGCNSKDSNREFRSLSEDSNREFRSLSAFCKKFFWFSEIKEGGGKGYIEGVGCAVAA